MSIAAGSQIVATDFISTSDGTSGKVPKTVSGKIDGSFLDLGCGDGSDGVLAFDGTTTILGLVPSGNAYTLTRDIYATNITLSANVTINTANWRIFYTGTLTGPSTATIQCNANNGSRGVDGSGSGGTGSGGAAIAGYFYSAGGANGGAANSSSGPASVSSTSAPNTNTCASGGNGGLKTNAGSGGTSTKYTDRFYAFYWQIVSGLVTTQTGFLKLTLPTAGAGGGGANGGSYQGGQGGGAPSAGGIVWLCGNIIAGSFAIKALGGNGGAGGNGYSGSGNYGSGAGGAGGGDGGFIFNAFNSKTWTGTYTMTAGTPGTYGTGTGGGSANGVAGNTGNTGSYLEVQINKAS